MGRMKPEAVVVTTASYRDGGLPDMDAFRARLPPAFAALVIGPIPSVVNDSVSYAFMPDGSKEHWGASDAGDKYREAFKDLFRQQHDDGSAVDKWVHVVIDDDYARSFEPQVADYHPKGRP